jgi:hypothetical protein
LFGSIFLSRFWAFRNKGRSKADKKNRAKISSAPKKVVTYLRHFFFFSRRPLKDDKQGRISRFGRPDLKGGA